MRVVTFVLIFAGATFGQPSNSKADLLSLTDQLQSAARAGDWQKASELSNQLKSAVILQRNSALSRQAEEQIDTILKWLPEDTETIAVAQQPFTLPDPDADRAQDALSAAMGYALLGLYGAFDDDKNKTLRGRTLRFALMAARKFASHEADKNDRLPLGLIAYQGCGVYAFAQPLGEAALPVPGTSILGHPVWEMKSKNQETGQDDLYLLAFPKPDLVVACNDREFLTQVLSRTVGPPPTVAFPATLSEWKHVERAKPVWAFRHFRAERAGQDPTYPGPQNSVFPQGNIPSPVGIVIGIDAPGGSVTARFISESQTDPWNGLSQAGDFEGQAKSRQVSPGVWELVAPADDQVGDFAVLAVMAELGFAILL